MKNLLPFVFLFFAFSLLTCSLGIGQTEKPSCLCCSEAHQQFDFWIGTWGVFDTTGSKVGENIILPLQDHCILQENWTSPNSTSSSYNYYNAQDQTWNQLWVDNRGNPLVLKGVFTQGKMVLRDSLAKNAKGVLSYNQITWQEHEDGSVSQVWEVFGEDNTRIALAFKGIYRKKK